MKTYNCPKCGNQLITSTKHIDTKMGNIFKAKLKCDICKVYVEDSICYNYPIKRSREDVIFSNLKDKAYDSLVDIYGGNDGKGNTL